MRWPPPTSRSRVSTCCFHNRVPIDHDYTPLRNAAMLSAEAATWRAEAPTRRIAAATKGLKKKNVTMGTDAYTELKTAVMKPADLVIFPANVQAGLE